jgi:hypothetical protein
MRLALSPSTVRGFRTASTGVRNVNGARTFTLGRGAAIMLSPAVICNCSIEAGLERRSVAHIALEHRFNPYRSSGIVRSDREGKCLMAVFVPISPLHIPKPDRFGAYCRCSGEPYSLKKLVLSIAVQTSHRSCVFFEAMRSFSLPNLFGIFLSYFFRRFKRVCR